jgi:hypothetical protein
MSKLAEIEARAFVLRASGLSEKQAMRRAAKEIARRERAKAAGAALSSAPPSASSLPSRAHLELLETCERWISHIWSRKVAKVAKYVRLRDRQPPQPELSTPTLADNPVVFHEPAQPLTGDAKLAAAFPAPLVVADFSSARIIPNAEFPVRYTDPATENWRASIQQNEQIAREKAARSTQLQNRNNNRGRYVG